MSEINVTPLVDVMLVLLVVFIVTAPLLTQSVGVNLPKTVPAAPAPSGPVTLVSVNAAGELFLDTEKVDVATLGQKLTERHAGKPDLTVQFEVDEKVPYGKAAEILAIAQHAGITQLSLQTRPGGGLLLASSIAILGHCAGEPPGHYWRPCPLRPSISR